MYEASSNSTVLDHHKLCFTKFAPIDFVHVVKHAWTQVSEELAEMMCRWLARTMETHTVKI